LNTWSTINKEMLNITSDSEITLKGFIAKVDEMLIESVGKWENQNNHKVEKVHGSAKVDQDSEHQVSKRSQQMIGRQQNTEKRDGPICWFCYHDGHLRRNCSLWRDHQQLNGFKNRKSGGEQQRLQNQATASPQTESLNGISKVLPQLKAILKPPNQITKVKLYQAVNEIVKGKTINKYSEDELWSLINELRYCNAASKAKEGMAQDIWTANVVRKIIQKRCPSLKDEWSESAFKIEKTGQEVTFEQFLEFLTDQAQMMGSVFGMSAYQED
jgi:hypothetical protein